MVASSRTNTKSIRTLPRWVWWLGIAYMGVTLITYIGAFPIRYNQLLDNPDLTPFLATLQTIIEFSLVVVTTLIGFTLMLRRQNEAIATLMAVVLMVGPPNVTALSHISTPLHPLMYIPSGIVLTTVTLLAFLLFVSLPDGYVYRRWFLWLLPPLFVWDVFRYLIFFVFGSPEIQSLRPIVAMPNFIMLCVGVGAMVHRYRNRATPLQRQQFKWLFLGIIIEMLVILSNQLLQIGIQLLDAQLPINFIMVSFLNSAGGIVVCVSLVLAISRYGLWDIDLTINRSVVAGFVTISLIVLFGAIFWLTQMLIKGILGSQQSEISVAISALAVGGAFNPVRLRIRRFVDRRLYGFRFDLNQLARHKAQADVLVSGALTGKTLGGYELMEVVGRGNMGEVYKGIANNNKLAAVKIMQTNFTQDDTTTRHRFEREGKIVLEHPNIVQTIGAGEENGVFYIVMEYVEGVTLKELLIEREHLPLRDIQGYLRDLAGAIDYAHAQGYVHRDIKPSNIMLRSGGTNHPRQIMLMDFGIAKILGDTTSLTGSAAVGTIDYMAPEQIKDSTTVDYRADIYALGIVLYETLTGVLPFKGNLAQVLFAHVNQPAPDIRQIRPDFSWEISNAIHRALQKDPNERFQSATEFVEALIAS